MNANAHLTITFAPVGEVNSWDQPIQTRSPLGRSLTVVADPAVVNRKLSGPRNLGPAAARASRTAPRRIVPSRCRYERRRLFAPNHTIEHHLL
jgi:hypothetical protein